MTDVVTLPATETDTGPQPRRHDRAFWVLAAVALVIFLVGAWSAWSFAVDDSFISYRYAANLAAGHGPNWNTTGPRVEGFTDFAWVMWNGLGAALHLSLPVFAKVTSTVFGAAILAMLLVYGRRLAGLGGAAVAAGAFLLFIPTYFQMTGGLETVVFAAVVLRIVIVGVRALRGERVWAWELPALLLLAGMLRPEGVLAALPALAVWLWRDRRRPAAWAWSAGAAVVGAVYFVWQWRYYGQLLPNTFYVKFGNLASGEHWTVHTVEVFAPILLAVVWLLVPRATRALGGLIVATIALTYFTYAVSGPSMDIVDRFAYHAYPVLCLGAGAAVATIRPRAVAALGGIIAVAWVAVAGFIAPDLPIIVNYGMDLDRAHVAIGQGLDNADVPPAARTLAVSDAGAIPYYSGWQSVDYLGLNDVAIAHGADETKVVEAAHPTVIVITTHTPAVPSNAYGLDTSALTGYVHVSTAQMRDSYYEQVFVLPQYADAVRTAVAPVVAAAQAKYDPGQYEDTLARWLDRLRHELP